MSFDGEMLPLSVDRMPSPQDSPIILISCYFNYDYDFCGSKTRNLVFTLTKNYEAVKVKKERIEVYTKDETKIIESLFQLIRENDVITGYNTNNFDFLYVTERAKVLRIRNIRVGNGDKTLFCQERISKGMKVVNVANVHGKIIFDVLLLIKREDESNVFKKNYNLKQLTLRHISKEILGIEKLDFEVKDMIKYWEDTDNVELRNKFVDYCSRDSEIPLLLITKFRLLDKFISLSRVSGRLVQDVINSTGSGAMVENRLLKEFKKYDRLIPYRPRFEFSGEEKDTGYELSGAEVLDPVVGVSENVCSVDYKSLYPTLMIKHNLCYSTIILEKDISELGLREEDIEAQHDELGNIYARFVKKEVFKGIVPTILSGLLDRRALCKKEMKKYEKKTSEYMLWDSTQQGVKILLNSFYGYSGDSKAKLYTLPLATAVTTNGRLQIKKTWKIIKKEIKEVNIGNRVFKLDISAGDTDSSYVELIPQDKGLITRNEAVEAINFVLNIVNSTLEKPMQLDFENYVKRMLITAKKKYAMLVVDEKGREFVISKGLETIKRDWSNLTSNTLSKVVDMMLKEETIEIATKKSIDLIKEQARLTLDGKIDPNDLRLSKRLTKLITLYDNKAVHCQVAIKMKKRGKPSEVGDRIQYIILDNGEKLISNKAEEADYVIANLDKFKIDYSYYVSKQLLAPSMRILNLFGVTEDMILNKLDKRQKSLFDF